MKCSNCHSSFFVVNYRHGKKYCLNCEKEFNKQLELTDWLIGIENERIA